jgi:RNA polymerase sigma factor (sigma-70 family)
MQTGSIRGCLSSLRHRIAAGEWADRDLLARFANDRDEGAFAALVHRHGPLVLGVCRRVLHDCNDADDAFQATFLVLARKAGMIKRPERLTNWLYGVAYRIAYKLRAAASIRQARHQELTDMPDREPDASAALDDLCRVLDDELQRLPEKFRAPLVLCYLHGKTREEAATLLGWTVGQVKGMLERGRDLLRTRLVQRGVTLSAGSLAALLSANALSAAVSAGLACATIKAALVFVTGKATAAGNAAIVAEGVLGAMWMTRAKVVVGVVFALALGVAGVGVGVTGFTAQPEENQAAPRKLAAKPKAEAKGNLQKLATARVAEAKALYETYWDRYLAGVEGEHTVNLWSRRWLRADQDLFEKYADRAAALAAHVERLKKLDEIARARLDLAGSLKQVDTPARELKNYTSAKTAFDNDPMANAEPVCRASVRWLMAQYAFRDPGADLTDRFQAHLDRVKQLELDAKARAKAGTVVSRDVSAATYYRLEAEDWLARGKVFSKEALGGEP